MAHARFWLSTVRHSPRASGRAPAPSGSRETAEDSSPRRRRPGLAERDRLVLLTLVSTGLRRSELLALDWSDLQLDGNRPSLLVRRGKGGKPRDNDTMIPTMNTHILAQHLPNARTRIYADAGHGFPFQFPIEFATLVASFLA
jgi:integrase